MAVNKNTVIRLHLRDPQEALERLNRVTGLSFSHWPQSLVDSASWSEPVSAQSSDSDTRVQTTQDGLAADIRSG